jgi:REP element-mobilizing transposase RayT
MVVAYHLVWTGYGWWLPNDPRGSTSHTIRSDVIAELGELHHGRKKVQPVSRVIREFYKKARETLTFPLITFDDAQVAVIAGSFARVIRQTPYTCYACAIMPDHIHVLIRKHRDKAEEMIAHLQDASKQSLRKEGVVSATHPVWGGPGWKVFLNSASDVYRTIEYIRRNPIPLRKPVQEWDFVQPYDGWLPGIGARRKS